MKKSTALKSLIITSLLGASVYAYAQTDHSKMDHSSMGMDHSAMNAPEPEAKAASTLIPTEAGNDAFGTIQEVMNILINDSSTDWSTVNLEALRQHLLDMNDMTLNVDVISQTPIDNGMIAVVKPTTKRSAAALKRVFSAHPGVLKSESGFDMDVAFKDGVYTLTTTTKNNNDVAKIRGLGYIGLMAFGNHHQPHHISMARGSNPHGEHGSHH